MLVIIPSSNLQFQYLCNFNKCLPAIISQKFWKLLAISFVRLYLLSGYTSGYIFWVRLSWFKIIKKYYKSSLKICELKVWINQMSSKMLKQYSKWSLISISSESSSIHLLIKVLYRPIWFNFCRQHFLFHALNVSLCY